MNYSDDVYMLSDGLSNILELISNKLENKEIDYREIYYLICDLLSLIDDTDRPYWIKTLIEYLADELYCYTINE